MQSKVTGPVGIYPKDCAQNASYSEILVDKCLKSHWATPCDYPGLKG